MFGTLRIGNNDREVQFIDRTGSVLGDSTMQRIACDFCRSKKLKCSGQRSGCDRCRAVNYPCVYAPNAHSRDARKVNKRGHTSTRRNKTKKHQRTCHTEQAAVHQVALPQDYLDSYGCEPVRSSLDQGENQDNDTRWQQQQEPQRIQGSEMANVLVENSIENPLPPLPIDFGDELTTSYEPQMSLVDESVGYYSMNTDDLWASLATTGGDACFAYTWCLYDADYSKGECWDSQIASSISAGGAQYATLT